MSQLLVDRGERMTKIKDIVEEEEVTESGVTFSVTSSPDDITTMVLHILHCFQSTHFLSAMS